MDSDALGRILSQARDPAERLLWFGAILAAETSSEVIVVGGSAIEIYSSGAYASGDVDLVGDRARLVVALEGMGFVRTGRLWSIEPLKLWVDLVGRSYSGDRQRLREFVTRFGRVKVASVEDLVAKRLIEIAVWPQSARGLFEQAALLANEYSPSMDWEYVRERTRLEGAEPLLDELLRRVATRH